MRLGDDVGVMSCAAPVVTEMIFIMPVTSVVISLPHRNDRDQPLLMFKHMWMLVCLYRGPMEVVV